MDKKTTYNKYLAMPKGELHVHLNGLVSFDVVKQIIDLEGTTIPEGITVPGDLIRLTPSSLEEYLKAWEILRLIPTNRQNLKLLIESAFINLKKDNVRFAELRSSILYLALINDVAVDVALAWLLEDLEEYAGKYSIRYGLIMSIPRGEYAVDHFNSLLKAYKKLGKPNGVVGLDLSGNEDMHLPKYFGDKFRQAKDDHGLGITIHAGETGNVANILTAINDFGATRIGHATAAGHFPDVMHMLREKDICIEACPISNRLTNAVKADCHHPIVDFLKCKVPFVLCSDNPQVHQLTLTNDYLEFLKETGDSEYLSTMYEMQKKFSFIKGLV